MTKRELKQEPNMPIVQLGQPGQEPVRRPGERVECDYCEVDAIWHHFAVACERGGPNRDAFACDSHVRLLNSNYTFV